MNTNKRNMIPLPIRIAHPSKPQLEYFDDDYFRFLVKCDYEGLYLQDSPFDTLTGNHGNFKTQFHLISLHDIARGPQRENYVDYINEVTRRAATYGLKTHLCCWEPRLPFSAWSQTPPAWRGRGGFRYAGSMNMTSFCWSDPDAVAYWKEMARDAFAALPDIAGVHLGVVDNEANFCSEDCPKCRGTTMARQLEDIYQTFAEIRSGRPGFRIAIYDWWLPEELLHRLPAIVGEDALIIGRSSQGHVQPPLPGSVEDMTAIFDGCGPAIVQKKAKANRLGLRLVDMPAWSHPNEAWWLPPPPDPLYAITKLNALRDLGASGWYDFDCGATEPGTIADAIVAWTSDPDGDPSGLVSTVLEGVFGRHASAVLPAYEEFRQGKKEYPIAYVDPVVSGFSGRSCAFGLALCCPFRLEDFRFIDTGHMFYWMAPYNLVLPSTLPVILPRLEKVEYHMLNAVNLIRGMPVDSPLARREKETFEIYHSHYRAIRNYIRLGAVKWERMQGFMEAATFTEAVREIADDESKNLAAIEAWFARSRGGLFNPCHSLRGWLEESWPDLDFSKDLFEHKRTSLALLTDRANEFKPILKNYNE